MTYATANFAPTIGTTNADFQTYITNVSNLITNAGLTQTADTGQINTATATYPGTTNTASGYQIWRFPDTLHTTNPFFMKLEYGRAGAASNPQLWFTFGTATDGAGNLSASASFPSSTISRFTAMTTSSTSINTTTLYPSYANYTDSEFYLCLYPNYGNSNSYGLLLWITRSRDIDGTPNGNSYMVEYGQFTASGTAPNRTTRHYLGGSFMQPTSTVGHGAAILATGQDWPQATSLVGGPTGTQYFAPVLTAFGPRVGGASKLLVGTYTNDVPSGTTFVMTHYGSSHTFMGLGQYANTRSFRGDSAVTYSFRVT